MIKQDGKERKHKRAVENKFNHLKFTILYLINKCLIEFYLLVVVVSIVKKY